MIEQPVNEQAPIEQRRRRGRFVAVFVLMSAAAFIAGALSDSGPIAAAVASVGAPGTGDSVSQVPDDTVPRDTVPRDTEPTDTEPTDTEPDDTEPDDTLVGAGDPDGDIDPVYTTIAIIGFVALVVLASWWMVRRDNPDAGPMPPEPGDQRHTGELI